MEASTEEHAAAVAAVEAAEAAGNIAAAVVVFDALDAHSEHLTSMDRYDFAFATWARLIDNELPITDADVVTVVVRAAAHLPESTIVDFIDARFGERKVEIKLGDGRGLVWLPEDHVAILSWPINGGVADIIVGRPVPARA